MVKFVVSNLGIILGTILLFSLNVARGGLVTPDDLHETQAICKDDYCGSHSYKDILKKYKGLFHTIEEISSVNSIYSLNYVAMVTEKTSENLNNESTMDESDDNSLCCSTRTKHIANTTMQNIFGELKYVVHLPDDTPPNYQYIPHGECVRTGVCTGKCVIESKIVTLLVLDGSSNLSFDLFAIPGYCTCKNIQS